MFFNGLLNVSITRRIVHLKKTRCPTVQENLFLQISSIKEHKAVIIYDWQNGLILKFLLLKIMNSCLQGLSPVCVL